MNCKRTSLLIALLLALPAYGQEVTGHSGVLTAGGTVVLTGTGLGTKSPAAPVLFDDFESHASGTVYANGYESPIDWNSPPAPWSGWTYAGASSPSLPYRPMVVVTDSLEAEGRGQVAQFTHTVEYAVVTLDKTFTPTGKVFLDVDTKKAVYGDATGIGNSKTFRLRIASSAAYNMYYNYGCNISNKYSNDVPSAVRDDACLSSWSPPDPSAYLDGRFSSWVNWQFVYGEGSAPGAADATLVNYWDGQKSTTTTHCDRPWSGGVGDASYDQLVIGGQEATNGYPGCSSSGNSGAYSFYDHIYFDTSWMRLEIGNSPIYDNCTERTIQIPVAWSATEITFTARTDQFANGDPVYLFVIGDDNTVTATYPMIVDDEGDPEAPGAPGQPVNVTGTEND